MLEAGEINFICKDELLLILINVNWTLRKSVSDCTTVVVINILFWAKLNLRFYELDCSVRSWKTASGRNKMGGKQLIETWMK